MFLQSCYAGMICTLLKWVLLTCSDRSTLGSEGCVWVRKEEYLCLQSLSPHGSIQVIITPSDSELLITLWWLVGMDQGLRRSLKFGFVSLGQTQWFGYCLLGFWKEELQKVKKFKKSFVDIGLKNCFYKVFWGCEVQICPLLWAETRPSHCFHHNLVQIMSNLE